MSENEILERALRESMRRELQRAPAVDLTERSVRRAREIRARRRLLTTAAVVAVVLTAGAPVAVVLGDRDVAEHPGVATEPPSAYATLAAEPLLTRGDLNPVGRATVGERYETESVVQGLLELQCLEGLPQVQAAARRTGFWPGDSADVVEVVLQLSSEDEARSLLDSYRALTDPCGPDPRRRLRQPTAVDVVGADEAMTWTLEGTSESPGGAGAFDAVGVARAGNVVAVLTLSSARDPLDGGWDDYAGRTLATALDRAS